MIILLFWACFLVSTILASTTSLTVNNIKLRTADGNWFVLYYQSAPSETSWNTLANNYKDWKQHGVYFGQVDCSNEKQLCDDKKGGDKVVVYSQGEPRATYHVDQDQEQQLDTFIRQQIVSSPLRGSVSLSKDWLATIESTGQPWFVKYYAPWCGHCKKMAPAWDALALDLENTSTNLAEVNCEKDRDFCSSQNVAGLPTLKFYHGGSTFVYADDRALDNFKTYVNKMTGPALHTMDYSSLPSAYDHPVSVVYIHQNGNSVETVKAVAKKYLDTVPFYVTTDSQVAATLLKNDKTGLVILKEGGAIQQVFPGDMTSATDLSEWVHTNKYPLVTRINTGNANGILKGDRLVVLMFTPDDLSNIDMRSMAKEWLTVKDAPSVVFAELNGLIWEKYVKRVYGVSSNQLPAIVIMDPKAKVYYNQDLLGMDLSVDRQAALFDALKHTDQLQSHTTEVARSLSTMQKFVNYVGDHSLYFGAGLLCLVVVVFTMASSGNSQVSPPEDKKKED